MSFPPGSPIASASSSSSSLSNNHQMSGDQEKRQHKKSRNNSKHPYRSEFRERQESSSGESIGPYDYPAATPPTRPRKSFLKKLTSCFEFDDSSDPVALYRPKHEAIFGKNPVYKSHQIQPQNEEQAKHIPSDNQAPNSFAGGMTGASGTGGGGCS